MKTKYLLLAILCLLFYQVQAQVLGCTDPLSSNYNPNATVNDGSCTYASRSVSPDVTLNLPAAVLETSGLTFIDNNLYTHNDDTDINIYQLNTTTGAILQTLPVRGTSNQDWEDIDKDDEYVYIGDFGNNVRGNRTNLRIIRVDKAGLLAGNPAVNSINFIYFN